jgi:serine protease Do
MGKFYAFCREKDRNGIVHMNKSLLALVISMFLIMEAQLSGIFPTVKLNNTVPSRYFPSTSLTSTSENTTSTQIVAKALPSVVTIKISEARQSRDYSDEFDSFLPFRSPRDILKSHPTENNIGSGFIVDNNGIIITNKHVVSEEGEYSIITTDNKEYKVTNIYRHPSTDLAILEVAGKGFTSITLGDSSAIKLGEPVYAIGTTMGDLTNSVTSGIVSGLGRGITAGDPHEGEVDQLKDAIQTDAAINPGNSGGPLINSYAEVIGINTAGSSDGQNIGFAIPINVIKDFVASYKSERSSI